MALQVNSARAARQGTLLLNNDPFFSRVTPGALEPQNSELLLRLLWPLCAHEGTSFLPVDFFRMPSHLRVLSWSQGEARSLLFRLQPPYLRAAEFVALPPAQPQLRPSNPGSGLGFLQVRASVKMGSLTDGPCLGRLFSARCHQFKV